jgi:hypothetical protein
MCMANRQVTNGACGPKTCAPSKVRRDRSVELHHRGYKHIDGAWRSASFDVAIRCSLTVDYPAIIAIQSLQHNLSRRILGVSYGAGKGVTDARLR